MAYAVSGTCPCGGAMYFGKCANPQLHAAWERSVKSRPKLQEAGRKGGEKGGPKAEEAGNLKKSSRRQGKKKDDPKDGKDEKKKGRGF